MIKLGIFIAYDKCIYLFNSCIILIERIFVDIVVYLRKYGEKIYLIEHSE